VEVVPSRLREDDPAEELPGEEAIRRVRVHRVRSRRFGRDRLLARAFDYLRFCLGAAWMLLKRIGTKTVLVSKTDSPLLSVPASRVVRRNASVLVNWLQDRFPEVADALEVRGFESAIARALRRLRDGALRRASCKGSCRNRNTHFACLCRCLLRCAKGYIERLCAPWRPLARLEDNALSGAICVF